MKILGYLISFVITFFASLLAFYILMDGFSHGSGSGAIVLGTAFVAFCTAVIIVPITYLLPQWKYLPSKPFFSSPLLAFTIIFLGFSSIYVMRSVGYFIGYEVEDKIVSSLEENYINDNFSNIAADMKKGEGMYLKKLAQSLKINNDEAVQLAFKLMCNKKFEELIPSLQTPSKQFIANLKREARYIEDGYYGNSYNTFYSTAFVTIHWQEIKLLFSALSTESSASCGGFEGCDLSISSDRRNSELPQVFIGRNKSNHDEKEKAFRSLLKSKYRQLIPSDQTTPEEFVHNLESEMRKSHGTDIKKAEFNVFDSGSLSSSNQKRVSDSLFKKSGSE